MQPLLRGSLGRAWASQRQSRRAPGAGGLLGALGAAAAAAAAAAGLAATAAADAADAGEALPTDKLACHLAAAPPRTPAVLVACGSFNPPTAAHLRMFDLAVAALAQVALRAARAAGRALAGAAPRTARPPPDRRLPLSRQRGYDVWGCYMSPVADAYGKDGLAPAEHRLAMCRLAAAETAGVMVDAWEARQPGHTRTLEVLRHVAASLEASLGAVHAAGLAAAAAAGSGHAGDSGGSRAPPVPRVMLLCGADLLATLAEPGLWRQPDAILAEHGLVCVTRAGTDAARLLDQPGSVLHTHREHVLLVEEPVPSELSSTKARELLAAGQPVRWLVPDAVAAYAREHRLYAAGGGAG
ncbi:nicotinamide/nicotinic acid mononucleotide adenylyltransferase [Scenedesmus sp. PABB004]|nr:nicotinamide/nicotinic acid mononucleotide adenylyltransferase [Scenedesmus sp. PABB004]